MSGPSQSFVQSLRGCTQTGPRGYCLENTIIHQLWWTADQIDYQDLGQQLGMEVITVSTILQPPGGVIPYHRDMFYQISQRFPDRKEIKVRANVFMQDCCLGHMIQYTVDDVTHTALDWQAGDTLMWDSDVLHLGANAGMQNKYTMQISGFLLDAA